MTMMCLIENALNTTIKHRISETPSAKRVSLATVCVNCGKCRCKVHPHRFWKIGKFKPLFKLGGGTSDRCLTPRFSAYPRPFLFLQNF
mmetsp:Transcript_45951/g.121949  ORF Transcript_45951/g.121949 Transcript_45951/m.121949 type:complete len:88 (-) Transcript_45951:77-340(-)